MSDFINTYGFENDVRIDLPALTHAVMDYFSDIWRLKEYQGIDHANNVKIKAYETKWLLKRHPLNLILDRDDDRHTFINEKFLLMRLASFMMGDQINMPVLGEKRQAFDNFLEVLFYYLKFRDCGAKTIELMLLYSCKQINGKRLLG